MPAEEPQLPSSLIRGLTPTSPPSQLSETITKVLTHWSSGLLSHEYPTEPPNLLSAFVELLNSPLKIPWASIPDSLTGFLLSAILEKACNNLILQTPLLPDLDSCINAANTFLLSVECRDNSTIALGLFIILHLSKSTLHQLINNFSGAILTHPLPYHLNKSFTPLFERINTSLRHQTETPHRPPPSHGILCTTEVLYTVIQSLDATHLQRFQYEIYDTLHPLVEHVQQHIRLCSLSCLEYLTEALGPNTESAQFVRGSLLWADPETAEKAVPLLAPHLDGLTEESEKCRKRVLKTLLSLMNARIDGQPCTVSAIVAVRLSTLVASAEWLLPHGQTWLCALGTFLARLSRMVRRGDMGEEQILRVCGYLTDGIRRCWLLADVFRGRVTEGCLVAVMEVPSVGVGRALRSVLEMLACCNPGKMRRMLNDLRECCEKFPSLRDVVLFLDTVKVSEVGCEKVVMGSMVERFFPELNQFLEDY